MEFPVAALSIPSLVHPNPISVHLFPSAAAAFHLPSRSPPLPSPLPIPTHHGGSQVASPPVPRRGSPSGSARCIEGRAGPCLRPCARAEEATSDVVACAEALARAYLLLAQRQAGAAAARRLRQASDTTVGTFLWVAYGESAPRTPSPRELLEMLLLLIERASEAEQMFTLGMRVREVFDHFSPWNTAFIMTIIFRNLNAAFANVIPTAPETSCPFIGIRSLEFDEFPVQEGLAAALALSARSGGMVVLCAGGLCICFFQDTWMLAVGMFDKEYCQIAERGGDVCIFSDSGAVVWRMD